MAYQPKSYRKFLATSVATALVATTVVPAAVGAAAEDTSFTDLDSIKTWDGAEEAIAYLVDKGAIQGPGDGTFNPTGVLTRAAAAEILAKALDLDLDNDGETGFGDVPADHWAAKSIKALKEAGIVDGVGDGSNYNPTGSLTRAALAKMVVEAYELERDVNADLSFTDVPANAWYADDILTLASLGILQGAGEGKLDPTGTVSRASAAIFVHRAEVPEVRKEVDQKEVAELAVESVSAINGKQIEVKFNKEIDEDSVIINAGTNDTLVGGVFTIQRIPTGTGTSAVHNINADASTGKLSDDKKTLTITTNASQYLKGSYTFSIINDELRSKDLSEKLGGYTTNFTVEDNSAPTVASVEYKAGQGTNGYGEVVVKLSEPVEVFPAIRVNNGTVQSVSNAKNNTEFAFEINPNWVGETINLSIAGAVDYAGNALATTSKSVTLAKQEGPVTIESVTQKSSNVIRVVFNRAIKGNSAAAAATNVANAVEIHSGGSTITPSQVTRYKDDKSNRTFDIELQSNANGPDYNGIYPTNRNSVNVTVFIDENNIEDVHGNLNNKDISIPITLNKDKVAPTIQTIRATNNNKDIHIKFNEDITSVTGNASAYGVELRKGGVPVSGVQVSVDEDTLILRNTNANDKFDSGSYTIRFTKGTDHTDTITDVHRNRIETQNSNTFTVSGSADEVTVSAIQSVSNNVFRVQFSKKVDTSALNPANYTLDGLTLSANADIRFTNTAAGASYSAGDQREVTISLPSGSINKGQVGGTDTGVLRVISVKADNGTTVTASHDNVGIEDNTKATLENARLIGNTIILSFDEDIDPNITFTDLEAVTDQFDIKRGNLELKLDGGTGWGTVATSVNRNELTITVTNEGDTNWSAIRAAGGTITIKTNNDNSDNTKPAITDANGLNIKHDVSLTFKRN